MKKMITALTLALGLGCTQVPLDQKTIPDTISAVKTSGQTQVLEQYDTDMSRALVEAMPGQEFSENTCYLLDFSGSMSERVKNKNGELVRKVDVLRNFPFETNAGVYIFSSSHGDDEGRLLSDKTLEPHGGTPLFTSMYGVFRENPYCDNLITLTDGVNNGEHVSLDEIVSFANKSGKTLSFVGVGISSSHEQTLRRVAGAASGRYFE